MLLSTAAEARHIAGGELSYEYLGPGTGTNLRYRITMRLIATVSLLPVLHYWIPMLLSRFLLPDRARHLLLNWFH